MNRMKEYLLFLLGLLAPNISAFDSFEHIWMGDLAVLSFPDERDQIYVDYPYKQYIEPIGDTFHVDKPNPQYLDFVGYKISLGEIIAIAGDYFTSPNLIISEAEGPADEKSRFLLAFSTFLPTRHKWHYTPNREVAVKNHNVLSSDDSENPFEPEKALANLRKLFQEEFVAILGYSAKSVQEAENLRHKQLSDAIQTLRHNASSGEWEVVDDVHTALIKTKTLVNVITSGWSTPTYEYKKILATNIDHFGKEAEKVYRIGHELALERALKARGESSNMAEAYKDLNYAYAMDAFAMHFLTDLFSSGHVRTPRKQLYDTSRLTTTAGLAANAMHDEDGYYGLNVENKYAAWTAYGDYSYFSPRNIDNRWQMRLAIRASLDEIWDAYRTGNASKHYKALKYIPELTEKNHHPLFKFDEKGTELVRNSYENIHESGFSPAGSVTAITAWNVAQQSKINHYDFRSYINKPGFTNIISLNFYCDFVKENEQVPETFSIGAFKVKLAEKEFKGADFEIKPDKDYFVVSGLQIRKLKKTCKIKKAELGYTSQGSIQNTTKAAPLVSYDDEGKVSLVDPEL